MADAAILPLAEDDPRVAVAHAALARRLDEAVRAVLGYPLEPGDDVVIRSIDALLTHARDEDDPAVAWLVWVAVSTVFPGMSDVDALVRLLRLSPVVECRDWLLTAVLPIARIQGELAADLKIVAKPVVDVHFSATDEHNSGIQRVVRRTVPEWVRTHDVELVAWTPEHGAYRALTARERHRVLDWDSPRAGADDGGVTLVVPWRSRLILAEVPDKASTCDPLAALARYAGSALGMIGYDAIPVVSAETVPVAMADHFARFLSVVKWSESVVAISAAAAGEFRGFVSMLPAQGLVGPRVVEVPLPADGVREVVVPVRERPLVVVVGSKEPRKNHVAVLFAAEVLWREGLDFELFFIGTYGWDTRLFRSWLKRLRRAGRPVSAPARVGDGALWEAYAGARFTVFPSLHEGYGLPVAESLAYGTPVITTSYGSTAEIAAAGGCVVVDPRDDDQLVAAMRRLLTDDAEVERLRAEARGRPVWTWEQYAAQVWAVLGVSG